MTKLMVVTGVTGVQGSSVAETFLRLPGWKVRGLTRNPAGQNAQTLSAKGVEIVKGDYDDKASLVEGFKGANVIFANTDFFAHFGPAIAASETGIDLKGRSPSKYGYDREVEQGLNLAEAAATPAVLQTLERFIYSSLCDCTKLSHGKYPNVYHYDCKADTMKAIRGRFPLVAKLMNDVQMGHYVSNFKAFAALAPQKQADGSFRVQRPVRSDSIIPLVVAEKDTGQFVKALVELPPGTTLEGASEYMTWPEWTELWGRVLGVHAEYEQISMDGFFANVPSAFKDEFMPAFAFADEFGHFGGDPEARTADQLGISLELTSMEALIKSEDWTAILAGEPKA